MDGYHNRPEKTAETVVDGWLRTGDIGKMDEDGYVYLLDRKSDMVISGGMNVYTSEVEDVVTEHPGVNQIAVIGVPHDKWGEAVHAVIIPEDDADIETTAIKKFAADRLSDYKKPKSVEFVEELPTTPYGKVDKKALEKPHWGKQRPRYQSASIDRRWPTEPVEQLVVGRCHSSATPPHVRRATVDHQRFSVHVRGKRTNEVEDCSGNIFWDTDPLERRLFPVLIRRVGLEEPKVVSGHPSINDTRQTAFVRIPRGPSAEASAYVINLTAPFDVQ